ncbi:MAG: tRNA uridine-5-carboxymethylaminomethyl(34) synthesis enzyme MnmG [Bacillota bacterium]|nr:tRNA uridine-5-carboxymethylaminomethyl(34) synthesis enzyme MnmG [Bacillota bacterium]
MDLYDAEKYDVAVIGAGHAGCEAALAAARMGCHVIMFSINLDAIANMPCNPNVGGTAKGHLVREIDALGGEMGKAADDTYIQIKMLNLGKGPAVHSLRAQIDRRRYQERMKKTLEQQENLDIKQAEVVKINFIDGKVSGVVTNMGAIYEVKACVIATGTFLKGNIVIGTLQYSGGPDGMLPANSLSDCLKEAGVKLFRFKTGTPARINRRSVNFDLMEIQKGDDDIVPFSFSTKNPRENRSVCYLTYTNKETHKIIMDNIDRAPLYNHSIHGIGPRYCPSIEDKVVRFKDKERHQIFIEPMGENTEELYVQGMSSSLPEEVQIAMLRTVKGLEDVKMQRTAYAIEYDCQDPTQLKASLEFKDIPGLFGAGQFNGSSGYEEAAAQGLIAGINAALKVKEKEPFTLDRSEAYIGVLIDDLTVKGTNEPYRMLTSRAEYRLLLRQDNADVRLTEKGYQLGLISEKRYKEFLKKKELSEKEIERCEHVNIPPSNEVNELLTSAQSTNISTGIKLGELIRRPELNYFMLAPIDKDRPELDKDVAQEVNIAVKYEGYIKMQIEQVKAFKKLEQKLIPDNLDYSLVAGLKKEAKEKLAKQKPQNIGQASRISGVSPADITVLLIYIEQMKRG